MNQLAWYHSVRKEVEAAETNLRAKCKAHLDRLLRMQPGMPHGLRLEKVHTLITELKVSWNKQEFRFLFFSQSHTIFIVHFFQKKTGKTPSRDIDLALNRMREIQLERVPITRGSLH
jgi:phage-related protein